MHLALANNNNKMTGKPDPSVYLPFHYIPTEWVGITFLVLFSITTATHLFEAVYFKTRYMLPTLVFCGVLEVIGWGARHWGHVSPHSENANTMQLVTTILAPSFMTAGMFLLLPKIIRELGTQYSRMPPRMYLIIFGTVDLVTLVIQSVGGAKASLSNSLEDANKGGEIMLGGISLQLAALTLYAALGLEFVIRYGLNRPVGADSGNHERKYAGWGGAPRKLVLMLIGLAIATVFVLIRSVYRTLELSDGWQVNGTINATEKWFNWFDGMPITVAMFTFNVFHPGYLLSDIQEGLPPSARASKEDIEASQA
ncbi:hypothetical protein CTheo_8162 [Ceratobasidium theobromae]|uniref:RTA1-domain-containing protein n=1 Tax=Ceratobasidium theobromae TaxID=1582974 RepID=A0A5N5Q9Q5_9AGAM|nr:hypothetical protein CTheo_8162 [Ceratobasidium theobromae]